MQLQLLSAPAIDLEIIAGTFYKRTGKSHTRGVDSCPRPLSDLAKFIAILSSFEHGGTPFDALKSLREEFSLLVHLHFSFVVWEYGGLPVELASKTDLGITSSGQTMIVSGTLKQWRIASLECCQKKRSRELRFFFDCVILYFEKMGLGEIWFDHRRCSLEDETFYLEHK